MKVAGEAIALAGKGHDRHVADEAQIRRIRSEPGMVFQQFNLWSHMTVLENVMEAPLLVQKRERKEVLFEAMEMLGKVGIANKAQSYPAQAERRSAATRCHRPRALHQSASHVVWTNQPRRSIRS